MARHLPDDLGQPERFVDTYFRKYCRDAESKDWQTGRTSPVTVPSRPRTATYGYLGRVDDVINVAGHRLGTKELEFACLTVDEIAEAAAVPVIDELRGRAVEMYVALKPGFQPSDEIKGKIVAAIEREIGKIARPTNVWIVPDMPKTSPERSCGVSSLQSPTSLTWETSRISANPEIVEGIRHQVQTEKVAKGEQPRELSPQELEEIKAFGSVE